MMSQENLEFFKDKLNQMKEDLLQENSSTVSGMKQDRTLFPDPNDRASLETDRNTMLRIKDRERKLLSKIQEALDRIENETFGMCESCEEMISHERLKIRPVTTFCISCKAELESEER